MHDSASSGPLQVGWVVPLPGAPTAEEIGERTLRDAYRLGPGDILARNAAGQVTSRIGNQPPDTEARLRHLGDRLDAIERVIIDALERLAEARAQWVAGQDALARNLRDLRTLLDVKAFEDRDAQN